MFLSSNVCISNLPSNRIIINNIEKENLYPIQNRLNIIYDKYNNEVIDIFCS